MYRAYTVPETHWSALHAVQRIIRDSRPPVRGPSAQCDASVWRYGILRDIDRLASASAEVSLHYDGRFGYTIYIYGTAYRLMSVHSAGRTSDPPAPERLQTNPHRWLPPGSRQTELFPVLEVEPGTEDMPVPLAYDVEGMMYVGWPQWVSTTGRGQDLSDCETIEDMPVSVRAEPLAPDPFELVPRLRPRGERADSDGA